MNNQSDPSPSACSGDDGPRFEDAASLVERYSTFGIPHFQRGLVWGDELKASLLESLYLGTPCGAIILWRPGALPDADSYGVPLVQGERWTHLIIDGQQRVRCLWAARSGEADFRKMWYLYLPLLPELGGRFRSDGRCSMFCMLRDPHAGWPVVSIAELGHGVDGPWERLCNRKEVAGHTEAFRAELTAVRQRLLGMWKQPLFAVTTLVGRPDRSHEDFASMVSLYNRINSSGKPVEPEERAFAHLVSLSPLEVSGWLRSTFDEVHGHEPRPVTEGASNLARDGLLRREREQMFGFKFYLRVLVQACAYHVGRRRPRAGFAPELLMKEDISRALCDPELRRCVLDVTKGVIRDLREAIESLGCDDLRCLPDTASLVAPTQLLLRFQGLAATPGGPEALRALVLSCLLVRPEEQAALQTELVKDIDESFKVDEAIECFRSKLLPDVQPDRYAWRTQADASKSLQHRFVKLLYWLERFRGARDLSYKHVRGKISERHPHEALLCRAVTPERQHLFPVHLLLENAFPELQGARPPGLHPVNDLGNLTWISQALNGFTDGAGADPLVLTRDQESENLDRHVLQDKELLSLYGHIEPPAEAPAGGAKPRALRSSFLAFCERRRYIIADRFREWLGELWAASPRQGVALEATPSAKGGRPIDVVERLHYPVEVAEALKAIVKPRSFVVTPAKVGDGGSLRASHRWPDRKSTPVLRLDLSVKEIVLNPLSRFGVLMRFRCPGRKFPDRLRPLDAPAETVATLREVRLALEEATSRGSST